MLSKNTQTLSKVVLGLVSLFFIYMVFQSVSIVNRRHISTEDGVYINSTSNASYIQELSQKLTKECQNSTCKVQNVLNYVTNIPYKVNNFQAHSPQQTIQVNYGDCDDKSNLLISLLHELRIESYFVLVPKHIFIIVALDEVHLNHFRKGLYLNNKKYYILESTAKDSPIGFPLHYKLHQIKAIIEPFSNEKLDITNLEWKL